MSWPYSQIKTAVTGDILTATDYNNEHQNHITNNDPSDINDDSATVTAMKATTDPGESGTESLAVTLDGEIQRLRFALVDIKGTSFWYQTPTNTLAQMMPLSGGTFTGPLTGALTINPVSNQLVLGGVASGKKTTITAPAPAADRVLTIPDMGADTKILASSVALVDNSRVNAAGYIKGTIVQTVTATSTTRTTNATTTYAAVTPTASITPKATTHLIKVTVIGEFGSSNPSLGAAATIFRGVTDLSGGPGFSAIGASSTSTGNRFPCSMVFLDSPASTSALTYTPEIKALSGTPTVSWNDETVTAVIILEEIAA